MISRPSATMRGMKLPLAVTAVLIAALLAYFGAYKWAAHKTMSYNGKHHMILFNYHWQQFLFTPAAKVNAMVSRQSYVTVGCDVIPNTVIEIEA